MHNYLNSERFEKFDINYKTCQQCLAINNLGGGGGIQVLCCDTIHMTNMYALPPLCPTPTKTIYELHHPPISSQVAHPPLLSFSTSSSFSYFSFWLPAQSLLFGHFSPSFFLHLNYIFIYFSFINIPPLSLAMVGVLQTLHKK
jgi:hypothetical protein